MSQIHAHPEYNRVTILQSLLTSLVTQNQALEESLQIKTELYQLESKLADALHGLLM